MRDGGENRVAQRLDEVAGGTGLIRRQLLFQTSPGSSRPTNRARMSLGLATPSTVSCHRSISRVVVGASQRPVSVISTHQLSGTNLLASYMATCVSYLTKSIAARKVSSMPRRRSPQANGSRFVEKPNRRKPTGVAVDRDNRHQTRFANQSGDEAGRLWAPVAATDDRQDRARLPPLEA